MINNSEWWKDAVVYQIYPRSFADSNGDGIGDIPGIIEKIDYLESLGIDVVWLNPVYDSPQFDNGYDIRDYKAIYPDYGTMTDMEQLISELHRRDIRIIMDIVFNHTSRFHPWFIESSSGNPGKYADYYHWVPGEKGMIPNNWKSYFQGSVWEWSEERKAHYLHLFSREQPDLNWENPEVREELYSILNWWLDRGADGFRLDVINLVSKFPGYPSVPGEGLLFDGRYFMNGPRIHEYIREMNERIFAGKDLLVVGETPGVTPHEGRLYTDRSRGELGMVFQFDHMDLDMKAGEYWSHRPWLVEDLKKKLALWQTELAGEGWNSLYMNNHDQPRMVSRFGDDRKYHFQSASLMALMIHSLTGTPYIYQGEEIGMTNIFFSNPGELRDIASINYYRDSMDAGMDEDDVMETILYRGRDNARTPMQWDGSDNGGFSSGTPWIRVNPNYRDINVASEEGESGSILNFYRRMIKIRKEYPALRRGFFKLLETDPDIFAFIKSLNDQSLMIVLNFSEEENVFKFPDISLENGRKNELKIIVSNYADRGDFLVLGDLRLRPYEAFIIKL